MIETPINALKYAIERIKIETKNNNDYISRLDTRISTYQSDNADLQSKLIEYETALKILENKATG